MLAKRRYLPKPVFLIAFIFALAAGSSVGPFPASAANGSVTYAYDALGRVVSASYDTGAIILYSYDANGNRTEEVININSGTLCWNTVAAGCSSANWGEALWH